MGNNYSPLEKKVRRDEYKIGDIRKSSRKIDISEGWIECDGRVLTESDTEMKELYDVIDEPSGLSSVVTKNLGNAISHIVNKFVDADGIIVGVGKFSSPVTSLVVTSEDRGGTWKVLDLGTTTESRGLDSVIYVNGTLYAVGGKYVLTSSDKGKTWKTYAVTTTSLSDICYADGVFVVVGHNGTIYRSLNGTTTWSSISTGVTDYLSSIAYGNGVFVVGGINGRIGYSKNLGQSFVFAKDSFVTTDIKIYFENGEFIGIFKASTPTNLKKFKTSKDGINWTHKSEILDISSTFAFIINSDDYYIITNSQTLKSNDLVKWYDSDENTFKVDDYSIYSGIKVDDAIILNSTGYIHKADLGKFLPNEKYSYIKYKEVIS